MNARRDKVKKQRAQLNHQLEPESKQVKKVGTWRSDLGKYLLDISKYVLTGVVIASLFQDVANKTTIYVLGLVIACATLITGLLLRNKTKEIE